MQIAISSLLILVGVTTTTIGGFGLLHELRRIVIDGDLNGDDVGGSAVLLAVGIACLTQV